MSDDINVEIAIELRRALRLLGADPNEVLPIGIDSGAIYRICEQLGAKSDLLGIVRNWGQDKMPDEWFLEQLEHWNARQEAGLLARPSGSAGLL